MRKVLFLMFLLLLMGLGAASVKAQVRIGGNTPPNPAAALDLNEAEGTTTGTKGLALPRVTLGSNTATLDGTTANITGMLVYNTGGSLSIGVYYWDGTKWDNAIGSPLGKVDTTLLAAAPASGSLLVYVNNTWRTATISTVWSGSVDVPANSRATSPTFSFSGCLSNAWVTPWGQTDIGYGGYNISWYLVTIAPYHVVVENYAPNFMSLGFWVQCLRLS